MVVLMNEGDSLTVCSEKIVLLPRYSNVNVVSKGEVVGNCGLGVSKYRWSKIEGRWK